MAKKETFQQITTRLDENWWPENIGNRMGMLQEILHWMGDPDKKLKVIHISGTNGKGSTGIMTAEILIKAGYSVGHFSTPAIMNDLEMITVNHEMISQNDFMKIYQQISNELVKHGGFEEKLAGQEWWTLIALAYFAQLGVDFVILESGRGSENDATNMVNQPLVVALTKINEDDLDETNNSLTAIAEEKKAIIKPGVVVVNYPGQDMAVNRIMCAQAEEVGAVWNPIKRPEITIISGTPNGLEVKLCDLGQIHLGLIGSYQTHNLSVVWQIIAVLRQKGFAITDQNIKDGLEDVKIKGRMEYDEERHILFDGAHNPDGIRALVSSLRSWHLSFKPTVILGLMENANTQEMLEELLPHVQTIIAVTPDAPSYRKAISAGALAARIVMMSGVDVEIADDPSAALQLAKRVRESSQAMIIVTGSFYTLRAIQGDTQY